MKILAINWGTNSTAALMVDGEIVACVSEERFSRIKNDDRYPAHAIEAVLQSAGLSAGQVDAVVFADFRFDAKSVLVHKYSGFSVGDRLREQREFWYPRLCQGKAPAYLQVFSDKVDTEQFGGDWRMLLKGLDETGAEVHDSIGQEFRRQAVSKHLGIDPTKVSFVNHHRAHGYHAYYGSPLKRGKTLILTADAWGGNCNATLSVAEGGNITRLSVSTDLLVARLYRSVTLLLGMKPDEHEYKLMGLAPYAKADYIQGPLRVFSNTQFVDGLQFGFHEKPSDQFFYFKDRLEGYRFDAIAGALQAYTEEILCQWALNGLKETGARHIVFGGGAAMNVKAMMRIAELAEVEDLFVCPCPSDESLAIGAAYVFMHDRLVADGRNPRAVLQPLPHAYLGPSLDRAEVERAVEPFRGNSVYSVRENPLARDVAKLLVDGLVVGRCVGRSEFGARALGNRSILADPRRPDLVRVINDKIKSRDFWMPFAPTVCASRAGDYLVNPKRLRSPYMTVGFPTSAQGRAAMAAAIHPADGTCRPQILEREPNPSYDDLVSAFEAETGVGALLNTSFNLHGEPIVQTAADAVRVFTVSGLDGLLLDRWLITKVCPSA